GPLGGGGAVAEGDELLDLLGELIDLDVVVGAEGVFDSACGGADGGEAVAGAGAFELMGEALDGLELAGAPGLGERVDALGELGEEEADKFGHLRVAGEIAAQWGLGLPGHGRV